MAEHILISALHQGALQLVLKHQLLKPLQSSQEYSRHILRLIAPDSPYRVIGSIGRTAEHNIVDEGNATIVLSRSNDPFSDVLTIGFLDFYDEWHRPHFPLTIS
jgi:hypothetical protein